MRITHWHQQRKVTVSEVDRERDLMNRLPLPHIRNVGLLFVQKRPEVGLIKNGENINI